MRIKNAHLTQEERCMIFGLKASNFSLRAIALKLGVNVSTISRELARNSKRRVYRPLIALGRYEKRRLNRPKRTMTPSVRAKVILGLGKYFSSVQISGSLKKEGIKISHESIYKFIWQNKKDGGLLFTYLRHRGKKYNKRGAINAGRGMIPGRVDISERPDVVETKSRIGDWEADTVIGAGHKGAVVTIVERKSKISFFELVADKTKESVTKAIIKMLKPHKDNVLTITYDNGKEFADHKIIANELDAKCYFARPYHSWERGLNEHTNGLLRQFIPKGTDFTKLTQNEIAKYQNLINNRPRKILNFNTPMEEFLYSGTVAFGS